MSSPFEAISTTEAPAAIGPYSQAVSAGELVIASGQIALDPETGVMVSGGVAEQTRQVLTNLKAVLAAAGCGLDQVLRCTVYMKDLSAFSEMNMIYGEFFSEPYPSRAAVEVARLPRDGMVEIDAIAARTSGTA